MTCLYCECGKEKDSVRRARCNKCQKEKDREKARLDAKKYRERHGSIVKRGIYCSRCKAVKENQERGYCLACERERYKEKSKPDCATCGAIKENPRDAYCGKCKRAKRAEKAAKEGRKVQNANGMGRSIYCSKCGNEKQGSYLKESYCGPCKIARKKELRPSRNEEQIFKEGVRRITWLKIREGMLIRQPCEVCGNEKVEAHHDDYFKPLEVRWLCKLHHQEHHKNNKTDKE